VSSELFLVGNFIGLVLKNSVPLVFASSGEVITERSGVINLGVEGVMAVGALVAVIVALSTGNPWLAILIGGFTGLLFSLIHGLVTVVLGGNQIVSGIALTLAGLGITSILGKDYIGALLLKYKPSPIYVGPALGPEGIRPIIMAFLTQDVLVYIALLLPAILYVFLFKTKLGAAIRACGENPVIAESLGVNVIATRIIAIGIGGFMAGIGGSYLSLGIIGTWVEGLTAGMGWIAVGLVAFGMWTPLRTVIGAYLVGALTAAEYILQGMVGISTYILHMLPYIATIAILTVASIERFRRRLGAPAALGKPYIREERLG